MRRHHGLAVFGKYSLLCKCYVVRSFLLRFSTCPKQILDLVVASSEDVHFKTIAILSHHQRIISKETRARA